MDQTEKILAFLLIAMCTNITNKIIIIQLAQFEFSVLQLWWLSGQHSFSASLLPWLKLHLYEKEDYRIVNQTKSSVGNFLSTKSPVGNFLSTKSLLEISYQPKALLEISYQPKAR